MAIKEAEGSNRVAGQEDFARQMRQIDEQAGIVDDPTMTHEKLRALIRAWMDKQGIRPEDNIGSRELMQMRYGEG